MIMLSVTLVHLLLLVVAVFGDDEVESTTKSDRFCRERDRPVTSERDDLFNLAEAVVGEKIMLQCHFCKESDDGIAKIWYKLDKNNDSVKYEVQMGTENNMTLNRIHLDLENTLVINNVTELDGGEYFCKGLEDEDVINKYNFFVDIIEDTDILPETGNLSAWKKYNEEQFVPINKLFKMATGPEYTFLRDKMELNVELVTEWDEAGPCEICGRPKGDGRRKKKGRCRLKIYPKTNTTVFTQNYHEKTLLRATHLSCRSLTLRNLIPDLMNKTQVIPDFIEIEKCDGTCNPDAEGIYKGWKSTKRSGFKYRKTFVLAENAHLTIICPESTLENKVVWKVNGKTINPGESFEAPSPEIEPRVTVDSFNTLYLYGVSKEEEGNYTCHVDEVRMQQVRVFVVSKAKLLTQAFFRHMMYLAFVLSLTLSCYCAGLVITWFRRGTFKTYQEVQEELSRKNKQLTGATDDSYDIEKAKVNRKNAEGFQKLLSSSPSEPKTETTTTTTKFDSSAQDTLTPKTEKNFSETTTTDSEGAKRKWFFGRRKKRAGFKKSPNATDGKKKPWFWNKKPAEQAKRIRSGSDSTSSEYPSDANSPLLKEFNEDFGPKEDNALDKGKNVDKGNMLRFEDDSGLLDSTDSGVERKKQDKTTSDDDKSSNSPFFSETSTELTSDSDKKNKKRKGITCFGKKGPKNTKSSKSNKSKKKATNSKRK